MKLDDLTSAIIGAAIKVHRALGPGLLESAYRACLAYELEKLGLGVQQEEPIPLVYESVRVDCGFRADLLVEKIVIVECKAKRELLGLPQNSWVERANQGAFSEAWVGKRMGLRGGRGPGGLSRQGGGSFSRPRLVIPRRVARQQSPTLFHQAGVSVGRRRREANRNASCEEIR